MKSGIMEIGDIFVVNKSDRPGAEQFLHSLKSSIHYQTLKSADKIHFIQTIATEDKGIAELYKVIRHSTHQISPDRSLKLLTQKAWQLVSEYRMRDMNMDDLGLKIEKAMKENGAQGAKRAEHFTLKTNPLRRENLDDFVACYNPKNRHERKESERFKSYRSAPGKEGGRIARYKRLFRRDAETSTRDACATQSPESGLQSALQLCFPARISAGATRDLSRQLRSRDERPS
jgi:hypothetical protein